MTEKVTRGAPVCFILAPDHHGAEYLSAALNNHPDIFAPGATNPVRGAGQKCSCGEEVETCPFWTAMAEKAGVEEDDPFPRMMPQAPHLVGNERINSWLNGALATLAHTLDSRCWKMVYEQAERFFNMYDRFYAAAREWAPHKVFVDGERSNIKFMTQASMGFPVRAIIHIVRDPRDICAIQKRYYPEIPVETTAQAWLAAHDRIRRLSLMFRKPPYIKVRYEDIIADSRMAADRIVAFLGLPEGEQVSSVEMAYKNHMIAAEGADAPWDLGKAQETAAFDLSAEDEDKVLEVTAQVFEEFGYKRKN
ncbi:MAG: hypothetical protein DI626_09105 [Micavibrio aeruginosavorus]|uniref:Sulfotransferase n=1 Tax=Micavibrio aeruginosavorus TaxID=349221 RepID=A0A2W4ZPV5_9BACT|nr:MAG: hypothetical protein DI626_09105 [Micavibrio aeruginosavorus]